MRARQLGAQALRLVDGAGIDLARAADAAGFERKPQALDIRALAVQSGAGDLERLGLRADRVAQLGVHALKLGKRLLGRLEPAVEVGQATLDGLLQHAVRVLALLELALDRADLGAQHLNFDAALVRLDQLARSFLLGLVEGNLDLAQLDGERGAKLVLVGLDVDQRHRHGRFEPTRGEFDGAVP